MAITIERYKPEDSAAWDAFVEEARNGVFLIKRRFMDYHAHRFSDHSLIARRKGKLVAVMPANLNGDEFWSHQGLSYGGWIVAEDIGAADMLDVVGAQLEYLRASGIARRIIYKAIPHIYAEQCAQEDLYALFRHGATLIRRDIGAAINLRNPIGVDANRRYNVRKAQKAGVEIQDSQDWSGFHVILSEALRRHDSVPVHSVDELLYLARLHPDTIALRTATLDGRLLAGAVLFDTGRVVHTQYLANSAEGRGIGALDLLIDTLRSDFAQKRAWLSFGISTEDAGRVLNEGLAEHKEGFGARGIAHDVYEIQL